MRTQTIWPVALALAACAPTTAPPTDVMAIVKGKDGTYQPTQVQLTTLRNVVNVKGDAATLVGGARIVVDQNDPELQNGGLTDAQVEAIFLKGQGGSVA